MDSGPLSQALTNLQSEKEKINALPGIPSDIQSIQVSTLALIDTIKTEIQSIQNPALNFTNSAKTQLNDVLAKIDSGDLAGALAITQGVNQQAQGLNSVVDQAISQIQSAFSQITEYVRTLDGKISTLKAQKNSLQAQLASKQAEANSAKKKELYLIALGPLGLIGLAAAITAYEIMQKGVNEIQNQVNSTARDLANVQNVTGIVGTLNSDFLQAMKNVSNIKNSLEFLSSDIANDIGDIQQAQQSGDNTSLKVFISASLTEVTAVESDAS